MSVQNNVQSLGKNNSQGHVVKIGESETSVSGLFINISADSPLTGASMEELKAVISRADVTIVPFVKSGNATKLADLLPTDYVAEAPTAPATGEALFQSEQSS